jgi:hypothetical protein
VNCAKPSFSASLAVGPKLTFSSLVFEHCSHLQTFWGSANALKAAGGMG